MALTTHYVIFIGLLSYCSSCLQTEKFIWNSFQTCYLFFWFFLVTTVHDSFFSLPRRWLTGSACCFQDLCAPYACAKRSHHLLSGSIFSILLLIFCLPFTAANFWDYIFRELLKKSECLFGAAVANSVCITGLLHSGFFFSHLLCMYWHWIFERSFFMCLWSAFKWCYYLRTFMPHVH